MSENIYLISKGNKISIEKSINNDKLILKDYPRGIYTTARTWGRKNIYDYEGHIERLLYGLQRIRYINKESEEIEKIESNTEKKEIQEILKPFRSYQSLYEILTKLIQMAILAYFQENSNDELKITILITFDYVEILPEIYIHISELPVPLNSSVKVDTALIRRKNAQIKDSQWTKERSIYEKKIINEINEVIMYDENNNFYEGLSSNFYIDMNSIIYSAPEESVLKGTISKMVFNCCNEKNIKVVREFPNAEKIKEWNGAFITSTSRLVLPITKIIFKNKEYDIPISTNIQIIKEYVNNSIKNNSRNIFEKLINN